MSGWVEVCSEILPGDCYCFCCPATPLPAAILLACILPVSCSKPHSPACLTSRALAASLPLQSGGIFEVGTPTLDQRTAFFKDISSTLALPPPPEALAAAAGEEGEAEAPPPLPRAPDAQAAQQAAKKEAEERAARQR